MVQTSKKFWLDWSERVAWTAAQAAVGLFTIEMLDLPGELVPVAAAALAAVKGFIAKQVGNRDSASLTSSI
jgi:hypothetical protein